MKTLLQKFLERTIIKEGDCWIWKGATASIGYGHLTHQGKDLYAHRVSYELFNLVQGEIPKGMCVCHTCDNPHCVNPEHLWLGSYQENAQDRDKKGRNGSFKLKERQSPMKGKHHSEKTKQKISFSKKGKPSKRIGYKHSEKTREKISKNMVKKNKIKRLLKP